MKRPPPGEHPEVLSRSATKCSEEESLSGDLGPSTPPLVDQLPPPVVELPSPPESRGERLSGHEDGTDAGNLFVLNSLTASAAKQYANPRETSLMQLHNNGSALVDVACTACGKKPVASSGLRTCFISSCRRPFCSTCISNASIKGVHLVNPATSNCAICEYQLQQRPNLAPHEWHWTFNSHEDLDFTRGLRDSLPIVPGLFLEIHASRQACWRRRVGGGIRKHYSFKQHGGFFEGRLQAIQVSFVNNTDLATFMMAIPPVPYHRAPLPGPSTRRGTPRTHTVKFSATSSPVTPPLTYSASIQHYLNSCSPSVGSPLFAATAYTPPPVTLQQFATAADLEARDETTEIVVEQPLQHVGGPLLSRCRESSRKRKTTKDSRKNVTKFPGIKKCPDVSNGSPALKSLDVLSGNCDVWCNLERKSPRLQASDAGVSNREGTRQAISGDILSRSSTSSNEKNSSVSFESDKDETFVSNNLPISGDDEKQRLLGSSVKGIFGPLGELNGQRRLFEGGGVNTDAPNILQAGCLTGYAASTVTLIAAYRSRGVMCGVEDETEDPDEPRCAICCEFISRRSPDASTCRVASCSRVFCSCCLDEGRLAGSDYFIVESSSCAICNYQAGKSLRRVPTIPPESWHMDFNLDDDREFLIEYSQRLPSIPGVWFDETGVKWRAGSNATQSEFSPSSHGGLLEARWEATQHLVSS